MQSTIEYGLKLRYKAYPSYAYFAIFSKEHGDVFFTIGDIQKGIDYLTKYKDENIWPSMSCFKSKEHTKNAFLCDSWLWVDIDPGNYLKEYSKKYPELSKDELWSIIREDSLRALQEYEIKPSVIIDSGQGYHAYWLLSSPCEYGQLLEDKLRGLAQDFRSDHVTDCSRILRAVGTFNTGSNTFCTIIEETKLNGNLINYNIDDFRSVEKKNIEIDAPNRIQIPDDFEKKIKDKRYDVWLRMITKESAWYHSSGCRNSDGTEIDRSKNDFWIATQLLKMNLYDNINQRDLVLSVLLHPVWFIGSKGRERGFSYAERTVNNAYFDVKRINDKKIQINGSDGKINAYVMTNEIMRLTHSRLYNNHVYCYNEDEGYYQQDDGRLVSTILGYSMGESFRIRDLKEVSSQLSKRTPTVEDDDGDQWVVLENGILNTITRDFIPHTPQYFVTDKLPIEYSEKVDTNDYNNLMFFLESALITEEQLNLWGELSSVALSTHPIDDKGALTILQGPADTGKSQLLRLTENTLGKDNCTAIDFIHMTQPKDFFSGNLFGKRANFSYDTSSAHRIFDVGLLKTIASSDEVEVQLKNVQPFKVRIYAKLFIASNHDIKTEIYDDGFYNRLFVLHLTNRWERNREGRKMSIGDTLGSQNGVRNAYLHFWLNSLDKVRARGSFDITPSMKMEMQETKNKVNPLMDFLLNQTIADLEAEVPINEMMNKINNYCARESREKYTRKIKTDLRDLVRILNEENVGFHMDIKDHYYSKLKQNTGTFCLGRRVIYESISPINIVHKENGISKNA